MKQGIRNMKSMREQKAKRGSTESRTRIVGFKVQSANHYTIEPIHVILSFEEDTMAFIR